MKHLLTSIILITVSVLSVSAKGNRALDALMERISPGLSAKVTVRLTPGPKDRYTVSRKGKGVEISANNISSASVGLNRYLNDVAGVQLTWDDMTAVLPDPLPLPEKQLSGSTDQNLRYYLNYCTHSYSMPFWDKARWQQEIDWMALHGINAALAITGTDAVWDATLRRLGYPEEKIDSFIASPAYQAWWLMNNLEGEGTSMTPAQLRRQTDLQRFIIKSMRELGIEPVFPGYSGMVPHDAGQTLGLPVSDPGIWCGYNRPAFLQPTDSKFPEIADAYYTEQKRLFGQAKFYSMDPFHEGGNTKGVDLAAAGTAIDKAMRKASPGSVWLIQGWGGNPRKEILDAVSPEHLTVLDLHSENVAQWKSRGHRGHPWIWCMLLNFGGNVGLHGKLDYITETFEEARNSATPPSGIGLTMEGIDNNPVMYELAMSMPWNEGKTDSRQWLKKYAATRYGASSETVDSAWSILASSIYGAPAANQQQGTTESLFCARPSDNPVNASSWANAEPYYDSRDVIKAAGLMNSVAPSFKQTPHFVYDLIDITRQAVAEAGRLEAKNFSEAAKKGDREAYSKSARRFLRLISLQDSLLGTMPHFRVGSWIEAARSSAATPDLRDDMERDARTLITTWGGRQAADNGGLHDYSNREWQGLLADFYMPRWKRWFDERLRLWDSGKTPEIDFYPMEEKWARATGGYSSAPQGDPVETAASVIATLASMGY